MEFAACYRPNAPAVIGEVIDGEAVIIHLDTGSYYSTVGPGADLWAAIEGATPTAALVPLLLERYTGVDADTATADVDGFLARLVAESLVVAVPEGTVPPAPAQLAAPVDPRPPYTAPVLEVFTDMEELILLDPVHDVDAAAGWPTAAAPAE